MTKVLSERSADSCERETILHVESASTCILESKRAGGILAACQKRKALCYAAVGC